MALPAISATDFTGLLKISFNQFTEEKFDTLVTELYAQFVREFIGDDAYLEIKNNDLAKWDDLMNGSEYVQDDKNCINEGLIYSVKRWIFFEGLREGHIATIAGNAKSEHSNSNVLTDDQNNVIAMTRYNESVRNYLGNFYNFIDSFTDRSSEIDSVTDLGGDLYRINASDTKYLYNGDTVTIANAEYVISNVVEDTSFEITSTALPNTDDEVTYSPFEQVVFNSNIDFIIP